MSDKSPGIEFDRQAFVQRQPPSSPYAPRIGVLILALVALAVIAFLAYKLVPQITKESGSAGDPALAELDKRLATIEGRLEKLETTRTVTMPAWVETPSDPRPLTSKSTAKLNYQTSPVQPQQAHALEPPASAPDPATARRLSSLQEGLGALQSDQIANREAWQATTDRLADVTGQVGTQQMRLLRSEDELNQLLARTQRTAIPFEVHRGSERQPVGPISFSLKSTNPKTQRYTLCVYVQESCVELKERNRYEVVQFVISRYSAPLEVIATSVNKDGVTGYLEVPVEKNRR